MPHGLRRGGLNLARQAKLTGESLKLMGDWNSSVYLDYVHVKFDKKVKHTREMLKVAHQQL